MGTLDRGGRGGGDGYGEQAETRPPSLEQLIDETRAERDAFRTDPANWDKVDPTNFPDRKRYQGESQPWTAEELARIEAFPGDEWDPPGKAFGVERAGQVADADSGSDVERPTAGEPEQDRTYRSTVDIREGLLSGKSVPEVRRELLDQPSDPPKEKTTELVRTEGNLRYELGTPEELPENFELDDDSDKSRYERLLDKTKKPENVQNLDLAGDRHEVFVKDLLGPPRATGSYVGMPHPPIGAHAPPMKVDGGAAVVAPLVLYVLAEHGVRSFKSHFNEWRQSRGDRGNAGD